MSSSKNTGLLPLTVCGDVWLQHPCYYCLSTRLGVGWVFSFLQEIWRHGTTLAWDAVDQSMAAVLSLYPVSIQKLKRGRARLGL